MTIFGDEKKVISSEEETHGTESVTFSVDEIEPEKLWENFLPHPERPTLFLKGVNGQKTCIGPVNRLFFQTNNHELVVEVGINITSEGENPQPLDHPSECERIINEKHEGYAVSWNLIEGELSVGGEYGFKPNYCPICGKLMKEGE